MHTYRFYVAPDLIHGDQVRLTGDEFHHCCHTLRYKAGDEIEVCDGQGNLYRVTLTQITRKEAIGTIAAPVANPPEHLTPLVLGIGITRGQALDAIVANATALGVTQIVPLRTRQSIGGRFNAERYRKVAIAALKQAGRTRLPEIPPMVDLAGFMQITKDHALKLVCEQQVRQDWWALIKSNERFASVAAVVGPEAGLTSEELQMLEENGFQAISLYQFRLRSELAVAVLLSYINLLVEKEVEIGV